MEQLIATIEKGKPFFNAIARNKYLKAIRDGFISVCLLYTSAIARFAKDGARPQGSGSRWTHPHHGRDMVAAISRAG